MGHETGSIEYAQAVDMISIKLYDFMSTIQQKEENHVNDICKRRYHEHNESDWLLDGHGNPYVRASTRWCNGPGTWAKHADRRASCRGHATLRLPSLLAYNPGSVQATRGHRLAGARFSSAQGVGVCWFLYQCDRCTGIGCAVRLLCVCSLRPRFRRSHAHFLGASTAKPYPRSPLSRKVVNDASEKDNQAVTEGVSEEYAQLYANSVQLKMSNTASRQLFRHPRLLAIQCSQAQISRSPIHSQAIRLNDLQVAPMLPLRVTRGPSPFAGQLILISADLRSIHDEDRPF
jgi:hypothetical protein